MAYSNGQVIDAEIINTTIAAATEATQKSTKAESDSSKALSIVENISARGLLTEDKTSATIITLPDGNKRIDIEIQSGLRGDSGGVTIPANNGLVTVFIRSGRLYARTLPGTVNPFRIENKHLIIRIPKGGAA